MSFARNYLRLLLQSKSATGQIQCEPAQVLALVGESSSCHAELKRVCGTGAFASVYNGFVTDGDAGERREGKQPNGEKRLARTTGHFHNSEGWTKTDLCQLRSSACICVINIDVKCAEDHIREASKI